MFKFENLKWLALMLSVLLAAGCSTTGGGEDGSGSGAIVEDGSGSAGESAGATTSGMGEGGDVSGDAMSDPSNPLSVRTIYFDYDQATIREDSIDTLRAHANHLVSTSGSNIFVEGHCDERGSREYNIALGERRANAVKAFLEAEGVRPSQIDTISYGEERPAIDGHDEEAWAANRRAELIY